MVIKQLAIAMSSVLICIIPAFCGTLETYNCADEDLQFMPGDGVKIIAFPDSARILSGIYYINEHGCADLPLIGMTCLANKKPTQIEQYLCEQYRPYLTRQHIAVRLMFRVALLGGFQKPGLYWVDPRGSLWSAIYEGGGVLRDDGIKRIRWIRNGKVVSSNITPIFQPEKSLLSIGFKSGDQLTLAAQDQGLWLKFRDYVVPVIVLAASAFTTYEVYSRYKQ